jgi:hypothetical protein
MHGAAGRPCYKRRPALLQDAVGLATKSGRIWYKGQTCVPTMEFAALLPWHGDICYHGATALLPWRSGLATWNLWHCAMALVVLMPWHDGVAASGGTMVSKVCGLATRGQRHCCKAEHRYCYTGDVSLELSDDRCGRWRTDLSVHRGDAQRGERMMQRRPCILRRCPQRYYAATPPMSSPSMAVAHGRITAGMGWGENGFGAALCMGSSILLLFGRMFLGEK